jgi:hypothetical protein
VDQAELELQLKVWKELAISKQILMRTATDALKLDPKCTQDELRIALDATIKKLQKSDADVLAAKEQARVAIAEMERKLLAATRAQEAAEATATELRQTLEKTTNQMAVERAGTAKDLQALKDRVAERDKQLKTINTALADTPENVVKKLNALRKEKREEADARRDVEAALNTLRNDKKQVDQRLIDLTADSAKLITVYREQNALAVSLREQLLPLVSEGTTVPEVPEIDTKLIENVESTKTKKEREKEQAKEKERDKRDRRGREAA